MSPPPTNIDGTDITGATIDGQDVQAITIDGQTVFTAGVPRPPSGVSRYSFEDKEDTTSVTDVWGNNDGSINLNTSYSTSSFEGSHALSFTQEAITTSNDEPVSFGDVFDFNINEAFSVVTHVNTTNGFSQYPLGKHNVGGGLFPGWHMSISQRGPDGVATFEFEDSAGTVSATSFSLVNDGSYHLIAGVHEASTSTIYIYIDGTQESSSDVSGVSSISNNQPFVIGASSMNTDSFDFTYGGLQDDVRLYDKALSSNEISNLFNTGRISG